MTQSSPRIGLHPATALGGGGGRGEPLLDVEVELELEVELSRTHAKPVVALPAHGTTTISSEAKALADAVVEWDALQIVKVLQDLSVPKTSV